MLCPLVLSRTLFFFCTSSLFLGCITTKPLFVHFRPSLCLLRQRFIFIIILIPGRMTSDTLPNISVLMRPTYFNRNRRTIPHCLAFLYKENLLVAYYSFPWEGGLFFCWKNHAKKSVKDWTTQTETFQLERELEKCWNYYLCTCICLFCCFIYLVSLSFCSILSRGWRDALGSYVHGSRMQFDFQRKWNCLETCELWWMHLLWEFSKDRKVECVCGTVGVCVVFQRVETHNMLMCFHSGSTVKTCVCVESIRCYCLTSIHSRCNRRLFSLKKNYIYPHYFHPSLSIRCVWVFCVSLSLCTLRAKGEKTCGFRVGRKRHSRKEIRKIHFTSHSVLLQREGKCFLLLTDSLCSTQIQWIRHYIHSCRHLLILTRWYFFFSCLDFFLWDTTLTLSNI